MNDDLLRELDAELGRNGHEDVDLSLIEPNPFHEPTPNDMPASGSFADRVVSRRVDLLARISTGIPPAEYHAASERMLRRGKRHYWVAPKKTGKSMGCLVHAVDVVLGGETVVIFDRENGGDLYASRLESLIAARTLDDDQQAQLAARLRYFEFPRFRNTDERDLVNLCATADLVVFDSQRMYLADLGLEENSSDDYAAFMAALVDPLFRTGVSTLILDNTGHGDSRRGRGASSKGDLNEILFALETIEKFNLRDVGRLRLEITDSRFGNTGRWELEIGGGIFGSWQRIDTDDQEPHASFRPTGLMERASIYIENCSEPIARRTIVDAIGGKGQFARLAVDTLVREGYARGAKRQGVVSVKPYREATDPRLEPGRIA